MNECWARFDMIFECFICLLLWWFSISFKNAVYMCINTLRQCRSDCAIILSAWYHPPSVPCPIFVPDRKSHPVSHCLSGECPSGIHRVWEILSPASICCCKRVSAVPGVRTEAHIGIKVVQKVDPVADRQLMVVIYCSGRWGELTMAVFAPVLLDSVITESVSDKLITAAERTNGNTVAVNHAGFAGAA